jgi:hypothetical protein
MVDADKRNLTVTNNGGDMRRVYSNERIRAWARWCVLLLAIVFFEVVGSTTGIVHKSVVVIGPEVTPVEGAEVAKGCRAACLLQSIDLSRAPAQMSELLLQRLSLSLCLSVAVEHRRGFHVSRR